MIVVLGTEVFSNEPVIVALDVGGVMSLRRLRPLDEVNSHTLSHIIGLLIDDIARKETEHGSNEETEDQSG